MFFAPAPDFAERLASGEPIAEPVAIVVAHPNDESLWLGTVLRRLSNATLIHLTDGAPEDMCDAARLGFVSREAYAEARAREVDDALDVLGVAPGRIAYGHVGQELACRLPEAIERLRGDLRGMTAVITHPYEGGHPDHDTAALAVAAAARCPIVEFACCPTIDGERAAGRFWPNAYSPERLRLLILDERRVVTEAVDAHRTQASVIGDWRPRAERWRMAPRYDFQHAPPPGEALYDAFGCGLTSMGWRALAAQALAQC